MPKWLGPFLVKPARQAIASTLKRGSYRLAVPQRLLDPTQAQGLGVLTRQNSHDTCEQALQVMGA